MGRKRLKNRIKRQCIRQNRGKMPKMTAKVRQTSLFCELYFWLHLAVLVFLTSGLITRRIIE
jgi:hypothetical protein